MRGEEAADLRQALSEIVRDKSSDNGLEVRRVTRTAARGADALLQAILDGRADGIGEQVTDETDGETVFYFMYDHSGYDDGDGYGPR